MEDQFTYEDFDLLIEPGSRGGYRARVVRSPAGESPQVQFTVPFSAVELENFVLRVGLPRRRTRGPGRPDSAPLKEFGGKLYNAVFQNDLRDRLLSSLSLTRAQGAGMRLRLKLTDTPELAALPWEFLYDQRLNRFLAQSRRTPLVRYLDLPDPPQPLSVEGPLRLLVMISSPSDYPTLDVEQEWGLLTAALAQQQEEGRVIVERSAANMSTLRRRLRQEAFHVFHFVGHGFYRTDWDDGVLVMEDSTGRPHEVTGEELGGLLSEYDATRLAVLNACEGARSSASDPFAGMAQSLIQQGLPAVVAMQFEITDAAAIIFARELYGALADGFPLEAALAETRGAIRDEGNPTEWGTPVLYSRAPHGRLFDMKAGAQADGRAREEDEPRIQQQRQRSTRDVGDAVVAPGNCRGWIDSPNDGDTVGTRFAVRGGARDVPDGYHLWIANRVDPGGLIWPKDPEITLDEKGRFDVHVYDGGSSPRLYAELLLVTAAVSADFERWLDEGNRSGNYPGVRLSPDSYVELASVSLRHDPPRPRGPSLMDSQPTTLGLEPFSAHDRGAAFSPQAKPVGTELARMDHPGEVQAVALSPDGTQFATVCGRTVFLWEVATRQVTELDLRAKPNVIRMLRRAPAGIWSVAFSQDGTRLAAVSGNSASVWQVATKQELGQYHAEPLAAAAVSPDIDRLAIAAGNSAWIWDLVAPGNGREFEQIIAADSVRSGSFKGLNHPAEVKAMAFSPDGVRLASVSGMTVRLWEVSSRRELVHVRGAGQLVRTLAFSRDSTRLATASGGTAQVWDMTGREIAGLKRGEDIRAMVFGSDGNFLTTIGGSTARLWDVTRREVIWPGDIGDGPSAFSQDSSKLATASGTTVRVLEIAGSEMATVNAAGNVAAVALSPDGTRLVTVTGTTAQAWAV